MTFRSHFVVEYESDGEDTQTQRVFSSLRAAREFARRVSGDGTAWPSFALLYREIAIGAGPFLACNDPEQFSETYVDGARE